MTEFTDGTTKGKTLSLVELEKRLEALENKRLSVKCGRAVEIRLSDWKKIGILERITASFVMPVDGIVIMSLHSLNGDIDNYFRLAINSGAFAEGAFTSTNYQTISLFANKGTAVHVQKPGANSTYQLIYCPIYIEEVTA